MQRKGIDAVSPGIKRITAKAANESALKFSSLAHHVDANLLRESLRKIKPSSGVGVDKESKAAAEQNFKEWSREMLNQVHRGAYRPPPVRRVYIPKPGSTELRPIGVPTIQDRCLQRSVAEVLSSIFEADFLSCSYGGRKGRGPHHAAVRLQNTISFTKCNWVYEADIKGFFSNLDHSWLLKFLETRVADKRILVLIRRWLKAGVMESDKFSKSDVGTPQGGSISLLLSNIYLHFVLDLWIEKVVKAHCGGGVTYVRYVDDFVLCFDDQLDAQRFGRALRGRLAKFCLQLEESKTKLIEVERQGEKKEKSKVRSFTFLGFTFFPTRARSGKFKIGLKTDKDRLKRAITKVKLNLLKNRHLPLKVQYSLIKLYLLGHYRYYGIAGNSESLRKFYRFVRYQWRRALCKRSQKGRVTWDKYAKMLTHFPLPLPRIYLPYTKLKSMLL